MDPIAIRLPDADGGRPGRVVANPRPTPIPSCPGRATIGAVRLFPKIGLGVSVAGWHRARRGRGFMAAEFDGLEIARQRIAKEARERTGTLDLNGLGLEKIPSEVAGLTHLRELVLKGQYREKVANDAGQSFAGRPNQIADLVPLARLTALQSLYCSTQVADLAPLAALTALQSLSCSDTQVTDLAPLARLTALQSLFCSSTQVADLAPLARLTALQWLDCSHTQVADLAPLARLTALQSLYCSHTQVADLAPLAALTALQSLSCSDTQVADLAPLARLTALQW